PESADAIAPDAVNVPENSSAPESRVVEEKPAEDKPVENRPADVKETLPDDTEKAGQPAAGG
ncbi:MAG: cell division protein DedD, partial [Plesiomonas sp.]